MYSRLKLNKGYQELLDQVSGQLALDRVNYNTDIEYMVGQTALREMLEKVNDSDGGDDSKEWWGFRLKAIAAVYDRFDKLVGDLKRVTSAMEYYSTLSGELIQRVKEQEEFEDKLVNIILSYENTTPTESGEPGDRDDPQEGEE